MAVDFGNSAFATTVGAALFPAYLPRLLPAEGVHFSLGSLQWTSTALSLWSYTVSLSIFITFMLSLLLGGWADEGGYRKKVMGAFTIVGALAVGVLGFCESWTSALPVFVVANIGYWGSYIFYSSLLSSAGEEKDWHKISLHGFAWGYIGGGLSLALSLLLITKHLAFGLSTDVQAIRWSFVFVGFWWLASTLPALFILKESKVATQTLALPRGFISRRLLKLWDTAKSIPKIPYLLVFMLSYAFFNDAVSTVNATATIFGKEVLHLSNGTLIGTLLMIQFLGFPFTLMMAPVASKFGAKRTLIGVMCFWLLIIGAAYSIDSAFEFWILGAMIAMVLGASGSLPRSIFAAMIPKDRQGEFFSFLALSGKAAAMLGPLIFGLVRDATGNPRLSILSLGILFLLGISLLLFVRRPGTDRLKA